MGRPFSFRLDTRQRKTRKARENGTVPWTSENVLVNKRAALESGFKSKLLEMVL